MLPLPNKQPPHPHYRSFQFCISTIGKYAYIKNEYNPIAIIFSWIKSSVGMLFTLRACAIVSSISARHGLGSGSGVELVRGVNARGSHGAGVGVGEGLELLHLARIHLLAETQKVEGGIRTDLILHTFNKKVSR